MIVAASLPAARAQTSDGCKEKVTAQLRVDTGNPARPPFGLERVGAAPVVHVRLDAEQPPRREYFVVVSRNGKETERKALILERNPTGGLWGKIPEDKSFYGHVALNELPDRVTLMARCASDGRVDEIARQAVEWPAIEADATARPDHTVNPVDLGAILVPHDTLLLAGGQRAEIEVAAISRTASYPDARLKVWFEGETPVASSLKLRRDERVALRLELAPVSTADRTTLHLALVDGGREFWRKDIPTMIVAHPPAVPSFGAVETKLRYDNPIAVGDRAGDYDTAWDPKLHDVVVFLPNGSRFVFWRWYRYAPFWAGPNNTGFNYEWAENLTHPFQDPNWGTLFPEPLFDRELRFSRVRIVESTSSRIHVRWTYEGTDSHYNRWGEQVAEDFYFYPDGFGTRVMTLVSDPDAAYEVSEFIILTAQGAYPLETVPKRAIRMLYLDGQKRDFDFPLQGSEWKPYGNVIFKVPEVRHLPTIFRIFQEKEDPASAIFFNPRHAPRTVYTYQHRYEQGEVVTPALGGRGEDGPGMNSLMTMIKDLPEPVSSSKYQMPDTLGRVREQEIRRWAWLIAKTDAPDEEVLAWAQSYSEPPGLELKGARVDLPSYAQERRAIRLVAEASSIEIKVKPASYSVNPVFELAGAPKELAGVTLDGVPLATDAFAWDGATLWVKARIDARGAAIDLQFR
ncbi:MAG TPA: hypothetical protein VG936_08360 [Lacunisphaera sp.]|nr:hypothetical protein [Lacunisphaera sp.]